MKSANCSSLTKLMLLWLLSTDISGPKRTSLEGIKNSSQKFTKNEPFESPKLVVNTVTTVTSNSHEIMDGKHQQFTISDEKIVHWKDNIIWLTSVTRNKNTRSKNGNRGGGG